MVYLFWALKIAIQQCQTKWTTSGLHAVIHSLGLRGLTPKEVHEHTVTTQGECPYTMVKTWVAELKCGRERLEDDACSGRLITLETTDKIHDMILKDPYTLLSLNVGGDCV